MNEAKYQKGTDLAPTGKVYRCSSCGKKSKTRYGFLDNDSAYFPDGSRVSDQGYDESCMLNSVLTDE